MRDEAAARLRVQVRGHVQGVGFRPFVQRLAAGAGLCGWVRNTGAGVTLEVEGPRETLAQFLLRLEAEAPAPASIQNLEAAWLDPAGLSGFHIEESDAAPGPSFWVLPDIATCGECLRELFDPGDRRYRYPFINCTHCGPRYSILHALPYDRAHTSMRAFTMCAACAAEYADPADRRHHAQPNACPECGPHLEWLDPAGAVQAARGGALERALEFLRGGKILAVKGLGGFHLMTDARNAQAVERLRHNKQREEKPFAILFPDLDAVRAECAVSDLEARALQSPAAPIVLVARNNGALPDVLAPGNPYLGAMLPSNPLHHIMMKELAFPVVATSGNLSEETLCTDNAEAVARLGNLVDGLLVHDRGIVNPVDDSIVRVVLGRELVLRRGRGLAPAVFAVSAPPDAPPLLAAGAHLKNTVALYKENEIVLGPHAGDLETVQSVRAFQNGIDRLCALYAIQPQAVAHDLHPDYASTQHARSLGLDPVPVQHHYAHVLACMQDNALAPPVLGVAWDGTGLGTDPTIWGGEFLHVHDDGCTREGHFRTFPLAGGDAGVRDPRRAALGLLYAMHGAAVFDDSEGLDRLGLTDEERRVFLGMLESGAHVHPTSSVGRLFDAVAALLGLCRRSHYEGQAAMMLEFAAGVPPDPPQKPPARRARDEPWVGAEEDLGDAAGAGTASAGKEPWTGSAYTFKIVESHDPDPATQPAGRYLYVIDWQPMVEALLGEVRQGTPVRGIAQKFHNTLAGVVVEMARLVMVPQVALTGGCFQNRVLTERTVTRLREEGFDPYWHQRIPPNDGGIAAGQALAALRSHSRSPGTA